MGMVAGVFRFEGLCLVLLWRVDAARARMDRVSHSVASRFSEWPKGISQFEML